MDTDLKIKIAKLKAELDILEKEKEEEDNERGEKAKIMAYGMMALKKREERLYTITELSPVASLCEETRKLLNEIEWNLQFTPEQTRHGFSKVPSIIKDQTYELKYNVNSICDFVNGIKTFDNEEE